MIRSTAAATDIAAPRTRTTCSTFRRRARCLVRFLIFFSKTKGVFAVQINFHWLFESGFTFKESRCCILALGVFWVVRSGERTRLNSRYSICWTTTTSGAFMFFSCGNATKTVSVCRSGMQGKIPLPLPPDPWIEFGPQSQYKCHLGTVSWTHKAA